MLEQQVIEALGPAVEAGDPAVAYDGLGAVVCPRRHAKSSVRASLGSMRNTSLVQGLETGRTKVAHAARPRVTRHTPAHVTLRVRDDLPNLRRERLYRIVRRAIAEVSDQDTFRICEFSVQGNHLHNVCEATDEAALARGVHALELRIARRLNAHLLRKGPVFADRYHARVLRTPLEVKNCLRYVLLNGRRHAVQQGRRIGPGWFDPCSSAAWFGGWAERLPWREPWMRELRGQAAPTAPARSWLLATGWKEKRGPISIADTPGPRPPAA